MSIRDDMFQKYVMPYQKKRGADNRPTSFRDEMYRKYVVGMAEEEEQEASRRYDPNRYQERLDEYERNESRADRLEDPYSDLYSGYTPSPSMQLLTRQRFGDEISGLRQKNTRYERGLDGPSLMADKTRADMESPGFKFYSQNRHILDRDMDDPLNRYLRMDDGDRNLARGSVDYGPYNPDSANRVVTRGDRGSWDYLKRDEVTMYDTIRLSKGWEAADKYLSDMQTELNRRQAETESEAQSEKFQDANWLQKAGMSLASSPAQMVGSAAQFLEDTAAGIRGEEINPYSVSGRGRRWADQHRQERAEDYDRMTGGKTFLGIGAGDVYGAGMSTVDMALGTLLGPKGYGAVMGAGAATSEAQRLYEQGASKEQIQAGAALAGAAELIFEEISLDKLIHMPDPKTKWQIVRNALVQGGIEGSEEVATELANTVTNILVMGKESDFSQAMEENGGSPAAAFADVGMKLWKAGVGGFLAGGPAGAVGSTVQYNYKKQQYTPSVPELIQQGLESPEGTKSHDLAVEYQKKLDGGKKLAGYEINRLIDANDAQIAIEEQEAADQEAAVEEPPVEEAPQEPVQKTPDENRMDILSSKYENPEAMREVYEQSEEKQDPRDFDRVYRQAHDYGLVGLDQKYLEKVEGLTPEQRQAAYAEGQKELAEATQKKDENVRFMANSQTRKGRVRSEGVPLAELQSQLNDTQKTAYKFLSSFADATGTDIVLFRSGTDEQGNYVGASGKFDPKTDTIYIDVNAGLTNAKSVNDLAKYTMMRTFGHEYTHFIEKWNASEYNSLRKVVFSELEAKGESVLDLIETKQSQTEGMSFDAASREVVAEAMTDIMRDSNFAAEVQQKNPGLYQSIKAKLHEFFDKIKSYFQSLGRNPSREARALQAQVGDSMRYVESVVKAWDKAAAGAVVNYQSTFAEDTATEQEESATQERDNATEQEEKATDEQETATEEKPAEKPSEPENVNENAESVNETVDTPKPQTFTSEKGYTVTENVERKSWEIAFGGKPSEEVRTALKEHKFRWSKAKKVWYGYGDPAEIMKFVDAAYGTVSEKETVAENATVAENTATAEESTAVEEPATVSKNETVEEQATTKESLQVEAPVAENATTTEEKLEKVPQKAPTVVASTPSETVANSILSDYLTTGKKMTPDALYKICDSAFGGTQSEGKYDRKDAYDAMELAVNKYIVQNMSDYNGSTTADAQAGIKKMQDILSLLPTQTVRTEEQLEFQQFSTPPNIAYTAAWIANIKPGEMVLEPSAGIGGLASFAKAWGAEVTVNELSKRRLGVLRSMGFDHVFNENAEQIDNVLPDGIQPSTVIMNPPFSSTAGRTKTNKTSNAERHIDQALERLQEGGRLVAIVGKGMNNSDYAKYWNKVRQDYTIRANIGIDGKNYSKYGTNWGIQIVVIDKVGPQTGDTYTNTFGDLSLVPAAMEGIRNDRTAMERTGSERSGNRVSESVSDGADGQSSAGYIGGSERNPGSITQHNPEGDQQSIGEPAGNRGISGNETVRKPRKEAGKSKDGGGSGKSERTDSGRGTDSPESVRTSGPESELSLSDGVKEKVNDDGVYATFVAPDLPVKGGKHPAVLVESAAMSAVQMPKATYKTAIPPEVINGRLSNAQMVPITYAGQAHEKMLPNGTRRGFFIGDGTGVGKGREIAGIILDNFMQGRKKAVWVSNDQKLYSDAIRDWGAVSGIGKKEAGNFIAKQSKIKAAGKIPGQEGILYTTYDTLKMTQRDGKGGNRLDQIVEWLGEDFDGVIAFDEAHNMGNLNGKKGARGKTEGADKAKAGAELQRRLPNARVIYVSATGATEVDNLAYAERLGLWGPGTAFRDSKDFVEKIGSAGLAAMELVVRDLKSMGSYVSRSISYDNVTYDTVEHTLTPVQTKIYNTMSYAWQKTMQNVNDALKSTGGEKNGRARANAMSAYYGAMQRFYKQVLTSMSMPSVLKDIQKELDAGHSVVIQLVDTLEAQQNRQLAKAKAEGISLDDLDMTPRENLLGYLKNSFPVQMYEEYMDDDGNTRTRPVVDSAGNPVLDKKAVRQRDALIAEIEEMSIPEGPLDMLFDTFGTEIVAENTGRSRRVVPQKMPDGGVRKVEERRSDKKNEADVQAFQDGKKRILVFSDAGGTGKSYHADLSEKNQQQRIHYVLQPGWVASKAVQGFGRTHRSNEASAPVYKLVTTNIKGQKRFTSTIARRLDQLGALTKGQRDTGSGMFGAKDNLETTEARDSLREFYNRLGKNQIEGVDGGSVLRKLGLDKAFSDQAGNFKLNEEKARDIGLFLNRVLALEVDEQNTVFDAFISIYEMELEAAIQSGTLDTGMENVKADKIEILDDKIVREDEENRGSSTHYVQAKIFKKPKVTTTIDEMLRLRNGFVGIYKTDRGAVKAVYRVADKTTPFGDVQKQYRLEGPNRGTSAGLWVEDTLKSRAEAVPREEWQKSWDEEVKKVPQYNEETMHMLTGALLPIWDSLPNGSNTKVKRLISSDGKTYLGRIIDKDMIDSVLHNFSLSRTMEKFSPQQIMDKVLKEDAVVRLTRDRAVLKRSKVSGEWRLEIAMSNGWQLPNQYPGIIMERISYTNRYFIPTGENGIAILNKLLADNPVRNISSRSDDQYQQRTETLSDRDILELASNELQAGQMSDAERGALEIFQKRLGKVKELEDKRYDLGQQYRELQFGNNGVKVDRKAAEETRNRMQILDTQIQRANADLLSLEDKKVLQDVLHKARKVVEGKDKEKAKDMLDRYRDRQKNTAAIKKYRTRIQTDVADMTKWVMNPGNKDAMKHIPDALKGTVLPFLSSIDLSSKRLLRGGEATKADKVFMERMEAMQEALKANIKAEGLYSGYADLPEGFMEALDKKVKQIQKLIVASDGTTFVLNQMTSKELKELSEIVRTVKQLVVKFNNFHANAMFAHVYEAGDNSIASMHSLNPYTGGGKTQEAVNQFLFWQQIRPAYAFERFGAGGNAIYDGLRRGQAKLAFNTKAITDFSENAYTEEEVKAWEKDTRTVKIGGVKVPMRIADIMSLYELSKRKHAVPHLMGKGIRVATYYNGKKKVADQGHIMTQEEIDLLPTYLTKRQLAVADSLQKFMQDQGSTWGNEVSVKRFGDRAFTEDHYFPIHSDSRALKADSAETPSNSSLYALLNKSFTKELTELANNRVVVYSIFDEFADHMSSMAQYNAMALPVLDALKWLNYKQYDLVETIDEKTGKSKVEKVFRDSVRDEMARAYGTDEEKKAGGNVRSYAERFVTNILKGFNGTEAQGTPMDSAGMKFLHRYNRAQVAFNLRSAIQQPMAITRAALLIPYSSIVKGMSLNPETIKANIKEMNEHSGIALWKSLGFYDVNISRGVTSLIKHDSTLMDKTMDIGLKGAETADTLTWAAMWAASKVEIERQGISKSSPEYWDRVNKLFEDVIYKTQVVDSVLTKNEFMRDKGFFARSVSSFMSEPITTASMLMNSFEKFQTDLQKGHSWQDAWKRNKNQIGRIAMVYAVGAILLAAVQAVPDAWRDDDDYETYPEKWLQAFWGNLFDELMPFNKLPIVSDFYELGKELLSTWTGLDVYGNPPSSIMMQWYDALVKGSRIIHDKITGEDTNYTWWGGIYKLLQAASGATGIPAAPAIREVVTAWNNTVGYFAPSLKLHTYDPGDKSTIKYAFLDGKLTEDEAVSELLEAGVYDDSAEARDFIQDLAIRAVDDPRIMQAAKAKMAGNIVEHDRIFSQIKGEGRYTFDVIRNAISSAESELQKELPEDPDIPSWQSPDKLNDAEDLYRAIVSGTKADREEAEEALFKFYIADGRTSREAREAIKNGVSAAVRPDYLMGKISRAKAESILESYKRTGDIRKWDFELQYKYSWGHRVQAYRLGKLSAEELKPWYMELENKTTEEAEEYIRKLDLEWQNPDMSVTQDFSNSFYKFADPAGISLETYAEFKDSTKGLRSDPDGQRNGKTRQEKIIRIISQMPISRKQKDALFFSCGYKKNSLDKTPWH